MTRGSFCFPPEARLKKRRQFLRIRDRGKRLWGRRLIFSIQPGAAARSRLGITVSRKVGHAVVRNRIKRWVREAFRQHPELFAHPVDLVITAKRGVTDWSYAAIRDELHHVLARYFETDHVRASRRRSSRRRRSGRRGSPPRGDL